MKATSNTAPPAKTVAAPAADAVQQTAKFAGCSNKASYVANQMIGDIKRAEMRAGSDKGFTITAHPHPLFLIDRDNGWACNGMMLPGEMRFRNHRVWTVQWDEAVHMQG